VSHAIRRTSRRALLGGLAATTALVCKPAILRAQDSIKIGFLGPLSGALAFVGQTNQNCLELAVDEVNTSGGISGRKLIVIAEDTRCQPGRHWKRLASCSAPTAWR
jgi:ABC-type branched-subunit amino acid transport system substrate-binding protein